MQKLNQPIHHKLVIAMVFMSVVAIWSTTPIAIKWSGEGVSYLFGISLRMSIGTLLAVSLVYMLNKKLPMDRSSKMVYMASALAIFGGMMPVYWGAQFITSGLISVVFGLSPIVTGYLAWRILGEQSVSRYKVLGALLGLSGLVIIFYESSSINTHYFYGIASILLAVIFHSISAVWIKSLKTELPALTLVAGGLLFSMPMFILVYFLFAPALPQVIPMKALWAIVYLGVVGSILGFVGYYYLLKHLPATSVALITLITPVSALWIGYVVNDEVISPSVYMGSAFILCGLVLHQGISFLNIKLWRY